MKCTLDEILSYEHPGVVKRFQKIFPELEAQAELIFEDLMRFFWASFKHDEDKALNPSDKELDFVFIMDEAMKPIDEIWHVFLLYTKDYMDFCEKYFGEYIHHLPDIVPGMEQTEEEFERNLRQFLNYSYDLLGEKVITRWFKVALV